MLQKSAVLSPVRQACTADANIYALLLSNAHGLDTFNWLVVVAPSLHFDRLHFYEELDGRLRLLLRGVPRMPRLRNGAEPWLVS